MVTNGLWNKASVLLTGAALIFGIMASPISLEQKAISILAIWLLLITFYFDYRLRSLKRPEGQNMEEKIFEKLSSIENVLKSKRANVDFDPVVVGMAILVLIALLYLFFIAPK